MMITISNLFYRFATWLFDLLNLWDIKQLNRWYMRFFVDFFYDPLDYCQDCGVMVAWGIESGDDIVQPAYATASGDLFCLSCGIKYDREEEEDVEFWRP